MANQAIIGDGPLGVLSVEGRTGDVILSDLYAALGHTHSSGDIISFLGYTPEDAADKGVADGYASLDSGGEVPASQIPDSARTSTFVVTSEIEQLALTVEKGDVAIRTDESKTYIALNSVNSSMSDWQELIGAGGGGAVLSVDSRVGAVTLTDLYAALGHTHTDVEIASFLGYTPADDALVVHLGGFENIIGLKIFSGSTQFWTTGDPQLTLQGGRINGRIYVDAEAYWDAKQDGSEKGAANGYAELDGDAKVPLAQLPDLGGSANYEFVAKADGSFTIAEEDQRKWLEFDNDVDAADLTFTAAVLATWDVGAFLLSSKIGIGEVSYLRGTNVKFMCQLPGGDADFKIDSGGADGAVIQFAYRGMVGSDHIVYVAGPIKSI